MLLKLKSLLNSISCTRCNIKIFSMLKYSSSAQWHSTKEALETADSSLRGRYAVGLLKDPVFKRSLFTEEVSAWLVCVRACRFSVIHVHKCTAKFLRFAFVCVPFDEYDSLTTRVEWYLWDFFRHRLSKTGQRHEKQLVRCIRTIVHIFRNIYRICRGLLVPVAPGYRLAGCCIHVMSEGAPAQAISRFTDK